MNSDFKYIFFLDKLQGLIVSKLDLINHVLSSPLATSWIGNSALKSPPETNSSPLPGNSSQKERIVFQPSICRCENVSFREGIALATHLEGHL